MIKYTLLILVLILMGCSQKAELTESYKDDVYYEIWVKSFADSDSDDDDIGDLKGIIARLDYLNDGDPSTKTDLGVTGIKISPFVECGLKTADPNANMHGYDATDFYKVNSLFGNEEDVKTLIAEAHKRGMKVLFDYVPNHTSDEHAWFIASRDKIEKRDWYVWDDNPDPKWGFAWGGGNWQDVWFPYEDSYYYSAFIFEGMPDLNFKNQEVRDEIIKVAKYWMDMGFDGLRVDAARYLIEEGPGKGADTKASHDYYKEIRKVLDDYPGENIMVAESWTSAEKIKGYYGNGDDEFQLAFDFPFVGAVVHGLRYGDASILNRHFTYLEEHYPGSKRTATFLSNHDAAASRPYSTYKGDLRKVVSAAALNILAGGVPFIYYGNEIGLEGELKGGSHQDFELRRHFNWNAMKKQSADPNSVLSWYRYLIQARNMVTSLKRGDMSVVSLQDSTIFGMIKKDKEETSLLLFNLSDTQKNVVITRDMIPSFANRAIVLGDPEIKRTGDNLSVNNIPGYGFTFIVFGKSYPNVKGFPENLSGGAKPLEFSGFRYDNMYLRGTMNDYGSNLSMKNTEDNKWIINVKLEPGEYKYRYEISGEKDYDINYGDDDLNGLCDLDGKDMTFVADVAGTYNFIFDFESKEYKVELVK
ncbi:MAG: alpha-amylase [Melioribacteraceae bacterium]|nr:MAG: alpha-amylase [Melioribacteraceae bacterium]